MNSKAQKLSLLEKVGYGSGDAAVNVVISSMFLIITYFYTDVFGLKPKDVALMFLLVRLIDAISDPLMGLITDKYKFKGGPIPSVLFVPIGSFWHFGVSNLHHSRFRLCRKTDLRLHYLYFCNANVYLGYYSLYFTNWSIN